MKSYKNLLVNTEMPISRDLKSEDFFSDQHPLPKEFVNATPLPPGKFLFFLFGPPTEQFHGKNVDLSVRDFNLFNTHPIRLSLIVVCNEQCAFCKKMKPETEIQVQEAWNFGTYEA